MPPVSHIPVVSDERVVQLIAFIVTALFPDFMFNPVSPCVPCGAVVIGRAVYPVVKNIALIVNALSSGIKPFSVFSFFSVVINCRDS